ncbi:hypothetical protein QTG54_009353 [Skeletonema marinoi]|uniref:Uncharacterized protein n=1 Tax=Skeletonema marinoi TaxID=267567 RepID=A0AAD8Y5X4_9STRA|nr:hypothetical protein QTG54_009353 [Skeletonema marinoi]|mmetsp:Transcript_7118/g.11045  ORF Transcript_7118/g.11045 Transcript_7118/m.11045 type:complete len:298 (+) Transcript_7118:190-1083(+)
MTMMNIGAPESWKGSLTSGRQNWKQACRDEDNDDHETYHYQNEDGVAASSPSDEKIVTCRGNLIVPVGEAKALRHVLDDLEDHFGHQRDDPNVRFNLNELRHDQNDSLCGDLSFDYLIDGEVCSLDYIGIDVCIDLTPKRIIHTDNDYGGNAFEDYGKSWAYVYVPELTMDKIKSYVKAGTGWDASDEGTVYDANRNLVAIETQMQQGPRPEPSFWEASNPSKVGEDVQFSRIGSVQHVGSQPSQQGTHRGVAFFTVSLEASGSSQDRMASLTFTLISVRTWECTNLIAPIVHSPRK